MQNEFDMRTWDLAGPYRDAVPATFDADLPTFFLSFYVGGAGTVQFITINGNTRTITSPADRWWPFGVRRFITAGTTATGIIGGTL